jgi:hypothetical protein
MTLLDVFVGFTTGADTTVADKFIESYFFGHFVLV